MRSKVARILTEDLEKGDSDDINPLNGESFVFACMAPSREQ